ncbi:FecCD family ABC transporter permease [Actinoplanes regularis]|uniref:Iron complex transport system permease protein n=1 Tax=Actinoplanes regularis TaxID=52697 RepID=A0A238X5G6_9ACTN|nr:iron ABC transporter permease [Actinoplanes regularis]GIE86417.1 ABC transporter permease [Actinoplanes regularis]SNR53594.1 iron complex transport system permease protein [Actinoplanes regularis]
MHLSSTTAEPEVESGRTTYRQSVLLGGLAAALVVVALLAAGRGQVPISPAEVAGSLLHRLGLDLGPLPSAVQGENALWLVRFPRVTLAILVGASLGCAGALMQGVFGNPLAEPGVVGVSAGAAVGAAAAIVGGVTFLGNWSTAAAAFAGGVVTTLIVYAMSRANGRTEVVTLVLTGVAVNATAGALLGLLMFLTDDDGVRAIAFWQLGSLAQATWGAAGVALPCAALGLTVAVVCSRKLDLLALGEGPARHLGVDTERLRITAIVATALLTASAVAFTGIISFVGLVVPHLIRMVAGPGHRVLIPASALGGAIVVVLGDLIARTAVDYQELPLGVLTAVVGGPAFFWLLRRTRARAGGWG